MHSPEAIRERVSRLATQGHLRDYIQLQRPDADVETGKGRTRIGLGRNSVSSMLPRSSLCIQWGRWRDVGSWTHRQGGKYRSGERDCGIDGERG